MSQPSANFSIAYVLVLVAIVALACESGSDSPGSPRECDPGERQICTCPDGSESFQYCDDGGNSWADCDCSNNVADGDNDGDFESPTDGCRGLVCGMECCTGDEVCVDSSYCCFPDCGGKICGPDDCGDEFGCGRCQSGEYCNSSGTDCISECDDYTCGSVCCEDPCCGGDCCDSDEVCVENDHCCRPNCSGRECGSDGCGNNSNCGSCDSGFACVDGECRSETTCLTDEFEGDDYPETSSQIIPGQPQSRSICPSGDIDWAVFELQSSTDIILETSGDDADTKMWLFDEDLSEIDFSDDGGDGSFSRIEAENLSSGRYYVKVEEYGGDDEIGSYILSLIALGSCTPSCDGKCSGADDGCGGNCTSNDCDGCCTSDHVCKSGNTDSFCGGNGEDCDSCNNDETCSNGNCVDLGDCDADNYEPDNSFGAASSFSLGGSQSHSICPPGDIDWVKFTINSTSDVTIETSGESGGDTKIYLYDSSQDQIESDDDGGSGNYSRITESSLSSGTYYVKIEEYGNNDEIGSYSIAITTSGSCTPSCSGKCAGASNGCGGTCSSNDCDGCCTSSHSCQTGNTNSYCGTGGEDCDSCVLGETCRSGNCVSDTEQPPGCRETITNNYPESWECYACASCSGTYNYECPDGYERTSCSSEPGGSHGCCSTCLVVRVGCQRSSGCPGDSYESDNSFGNAKTITAGNPQNHSICPAGDVDYLRFTLSTTSDVTILTSGTSGDTKLYLYNSSQSQIDFDDDGGSDNFSRISRTGMSSGTYYIKVEEYGNNDEIASYHISLTVGGSCTPSCSGKCAGASNGCGGTCSTNQCPGCCTSSHSCQTGNTSSYCGTSGEDCDSCVSGEYCSGGNCVSSCTPSCSGKCIGASDGCGGTCSTNRCSGCCTSSHSCQTGNTSSYCGTSGEDCDSCVSGEYCSGGNCIAQSTCDEDGYENDDNSGSATYIGLGYNQGHSICPAGDVDWVRFSISTTSDVVIETSGDSGGDTKIYLYNSSLSQIANDDDGGSGNYSRISRSNLASGTYYVKVEEYGNNGEIENYSIRVTASGSCTPSCSGKCDGASNGCGGTCSSNDCDGCCTTSHNCMTGTNSSYCGRYGEDCDSCTSNESCLSGNCVDQGCDGFECYDGECISDSWVCDGMDDCNGGEDEEQDMAECCNPNNDDDIYEPNDNEDSTGGGTFTENCSDGSSSTHIGGLIDTYSDEDWFKWNVTEQTLCYVDPTFDFTCISPGSSYAQIDIVFICSASNSTPVGSSGYNLDSGSGCRVCDTYSCSDDVPMPGATSYWIRCESSGNDLESPSISFSPDCPLTTNDSGQVYLRIQSSWGDDFGYDIEAHM